MIVTFNAAAFYGLTRFRVPAEVSLVVLAAVAIARLESAGGQQSPDMLRDLTACGAVLHWTWRTSTVPARHLAHAGHPPAPSVPISVVARQCVEEVDAVGRLGPPNPGRHAPGRDPKQRPPVLFFGARPFHW